MDNELKILKMIDLCTGGHVSRKFLMLFSLPKKLQKNEGLENCLPITNPDD